MNTSIGGATPSASCSGRRSASDLGTSSPKDDFNIRNAGKGEHRGYAVGEERCVGQRACSGRSNNGATTGSPIQPSARLATVTPNCTADNVAFIELRNWTTARAPGLDCATSCSTRVPRKLTSANSAATKKLFARMRATMATPWKSVQCTMGIG